MSAQQIERLVDAAVVELGSTAAASAVSTLAGEARTLWDFTSPARGARGIHVVITPSTAPAAAPEAAVEHVWDWVARAVGALPAGLVAVPELSSLGDAAATLDRLSLTRLAQALDQLVEGAGLPALRLQWADGLQPRRGDVLVLDALPHLVDTTRRLCGHVRCADAAGAVAHPVVESLVALAGRQPNRAPIGLASGQAAPVEPSVTIHAVGTFPTPAGRVAARAWTSRLACSARRRSGLPFADGAPAGGFDIPTSGQAPSTETAFRVLTAPIGGQNRVWI